MPKKERPVERVVRLAGGQAELARRCNTSQPRIWQCIHRNQRVPADLVIPFERAVAGQVTRYELRPDLYPDDKPSTSAVAS
jgi:DNA-binding transcriptional regulator YdaS (Cro superfamily)